MLHCGNTFCEMTLWTEQMVVGRGGVVQFISNRVGTGDVFAKVARV